MNPFHTIVYDDVNIWYSYGGKAVPINIDNAPKREQEEIVVPGRNGALIIDKNQYSNVELGYTIIFYENVRSQALGTTARERAESCKNMLLSKSGYKQLKDTQQLSTDYYMAIVSRDLEPVISTDDNLAKFEVWFSRKPQIYMSSGALEWMVTNTANITNPTRFDAQPLITAYGAGTFKVNDQTITISSADEYTVIDSEMMDCYKGSVSKNGLVTFSDHEFPVLVPGVNAVEISSGITKLLVVPRWWRL